MSSGCDLFQPKRYVETNKGSTQAQERQPVSEEEKQSPIVLENDNSNKPIKVIGDKNEEWIVEKKNSYHITLLLPSEIQQFGDEHDGLSRLNNYYIQFLNGMALVLRQHHQLPQVTMNVKRVSSDGNLSYELEKLKYTSDVIIGGANSDQVKSLAQFAKKNKIMCLSPFIPVSDVTHQNKYFIQIMPDLESYVEAITEHVLTMHQGADIYLLGPAGLTERFHLFDVAKKDFLGIKEGQPFEAFNRFYIDENSVAELNIDTFGFSDKQVFIIPLDRNKEYLYQVLTKLSTMKTDKELIVYGIPPWDRYDLLYQFFEPLNIHLPSHATVYLQQFKKFEKEYYNQFHAIPDPIAGSGYDLMNWIIETLKEKGTLIHPGLLEINATYGVSTKWKFRVVEPKLSIDKNGGMINMDYLENTGIIVEGFN